MTDKTTISHVVLILGLLAIGGLAGAVWLNSMGKPVDPLIGYVVTTSLGAIAALLASTKVDPSQLPRADKPVSGGEPLPASTPYRGAGGNG